MNANAQPQVQTPVQRPGELASAVPDGRYTRTAVVLHWLMAVMLLGLFGVGLYMVDLPISVQRLKLYTWHKWAGIAVLALALVRLLWRLSHRPPPAVPMPPWQARVAHLTHGLLYVLFFAVPLVGWAYSSASGYPVVWFGVLPLPDFVPKSPELAAVIKPWHEILAWALVLLAALHVAGAIKHHVIDKDALLARMGWRR